MATPPKVGARNDMAALREARRRVGNALQLAQRTMDEIGRMREAVGRPDYGRLERLIGQLAVSLAQAGRELEAMLEIRLVAQDSSEPSLAQRVQALERVVAELQASRQNEA